VAQAFDSDPTQASLWRPLRGLLARIDGDIARVYEDAQLTGVKPSYVMELLRLHAHGPMTIAELAESVGKTHSALSQKVSAMRNAGLVRTTSGVDARSKRVHLTAKSSRIVGRLASEWRATEEALAELEHEIPYPLSTVVADIDAALAHESFYDRLTRRLKDDPGWP
jgi:DNA-binding MarR family transcriptional regulator